MLNPEQAAAVNSGAKKTIVLAGPGSGKSRVVVERVLRLVTLGIDPRSLVVLTYTNAAAHVLVERLAKHAIVLGYIGTLHGYCLRLIQTHGHLIGYRSGSVSLVTEEAKEVLLDETKKRLGSKISDKALKAHDTPEAGLIWNEYHHTLKRSNMVDYDKILSEALVIFPKLLGKWKPVAELIVDEGQDSAAIDWALYAAISENWFIVGDQDQGIYSFRGGRPDMLATWAAAADADVYTLALNYRSDAAICEAATKLIRYNSGRIDKPVLPLPDAFEGEVDVLAYDNGLKEIHGCAYQFKDCPSGDIAVLARTNALADFARQTLRGLGLPIRNTGKIAMPEDWGFALATISLMVDPCNDYHAERVLKELGRSQLEINTAKLQALRDGVALSTTGKLSSLSNVAAQKPGDWLTALALFGVRDASRELIAERLKVLPNAEPTLSDLLADLWKNEAWSHEDSGDGITVTTIHGAKGKEWDMVFVVGCEEGILPSNQALKSCEASGGWLPIEGGVVLFGKEAHRRAVGGSPIEEERRLLYVAMTRARHSLILSWAKERTAYWKTTQQTPSRFLQECQ